MCTLSIYIYITANLFIIHMRMYTMPCMERMLMPRTVSQPQPEAGPLTAKSCIRKRSDTSDAECSACTWQQDLCRRVWADWRPACHRPPCLLHPPHPGQSSGLLGGGHPAAHLHGSSGWAGRAPAETCLLLDSCPECCRRP